MRKLFGVWLLLAAGCTITTTSPPATTSPRGRILAMPVPPAPIPLTRVGVEYLPPERPGVDLPLPLGPGDRKQAPLSASPDPLADLFAPTPEVQATGEPIPDRPNWLDRSSLEPGNGAELVARLDLSRERIAAVHDTAERLALRFWREVVGSDPRRLEHTFGSPVMTGQFGYGSPEIPITYVDQRHNEDQLKQMKRYGTRFLRRPARRALKELSVVSDVEQALDDFKAVNIPLTGSYQEQHEKRHRGRFSLHLSRSSGSADPVEIYYLHSGWKIGGGVDTARVQYSRNLTKNLRFNLASSYGYDDQEMEVLGSLAYEVSPRTTLNLVAGNNMNVLTGPFTYIGTPPAQEPSQAVAFYVEHVF